MAKTRLSANITARSVPLTSGDTRLKPDGSVVAAVPLADMVSGAWPYPDPETTIRGAVRSHLEDKAKIAELVAHILSAKIDVYEGLHKIAALARS